MTMKYSLISIAIASLLASASCGDDSQTGDAGADLSATADLRGLKPPVDLAGVDFAGISCGTMTCSGTDVCCLVPNTSSSTLVTATCSPAGSCGDGGIPTSCDGPEDCPGANGCCIGLNIGGSGEISGSATCPNATCAASIVQSGGGGAITTKLCHGAADCTGFSGPTPLGDQPYSGCCTYPGITFNFCAPSIIIMAALSGATCM